MNKYDETTSEGSRSLIYRILYTARAGHVCEDPAEGWKSNCGECLSFRHRARHNIIGVRVYVYIIIYSTVVGHNIILFDTYTAARIVLRVLGCVYIWCHYIPLCIIIIPDFVKNIDFPTNDARILYYYYYLYPLALL